ncbi:MAG: NnrS family protein [Telluria sp.]|nr:NnrS family protein [Telluria sp.]
MTTLSARFASGLFAAPLWRSAFRPFFLLGAAFGALLMLTWLGAYIDVRPPLPSGMPLKFWHGHEIVFGFAGAVITGIMLSALPSWAGTEEIRGGRLALLVALWLAGRGAVWLAPMLPTVLVAALDCALFVTVGAMLTPQLLRAKNKRYLLLLPVLAGLCGANLAFHLGYHGFGLRLALYGIMLLYSQASLLTPLFTGNTLREKKRGGAIPPCRTLDLLAAVSVLLLGAADLAGLPAPVTGLAAAGACIVHALRLARWRGWLVMDTSLVFTMHLGYAWLVVALGLKAAAQFTGAVPQAAWLHAFTVGALGMMMMGLMARVVLRHTGRELTPPAGTTSAFTLMFGAALLRVATSVFHLDAVYVALSAMLWMVPFLAYLVLFGPMLWRPSMPIMRHC